MSRTELQLAIYRVKHHWQRFGLTARLRPAKLGPAIGIGIGIIVGLGMAASGWSIGQSPLWLGLGSRIGALLLVLVAVLQGPFFRAGWCNCAPMCSRYIRAIILIDGSSVR